MRSAIHKQDRIMMADVAHMRSWARIGIRQGGLFPSSDRRLATTAGAPALALPSVATPCSGEGIRPLSCLERRCAGLIKGGP